MFFGVHLDGLVHMYTAIFLTNVALSVSFVSFQDEDFQITLFYRFWFCFVFFLPYPFNSMPSFVSATISPEATAD